MSSRSRLRRAGSALLAVYRVCARTIKLLVLLVLAVGVAAAGYVTYVFQQAGVKVREIPALTDPGRAPLPQAVKFYSADGVMLGELRTEQRTVLAPRDVPKVIRQATVAIEDQRFYQHRGVDFQAVGRAAWTNFRAGSSAQGGSTITMQYIRNVYLDFEKTSARKLKEVALALQLESVWTKQRILESYLNTVYYGNGAYGIEAASRIYFHRRAKDLTLAQAALLAALPQNANMLNPRTNLTAARARQALVLDEMYAQGMISRQRLLEAKQTKVKVFKARKDQRPLDPALLAYADRELNATLNKRRRLRGGLKVFTSLNYAEIRKARRTLRTAYPGLTAGKAPAVAAAIVDPRDGRIKVLAHSKSGQFDLSWQARRQPGSTVKPFTVASYLTRGGQLADPVDNSPLEVSRGQGQGTYTVQPSNAMTRTVQDALRFSQNPSMWRLYQKAGPRRVLALQRRAGMTQMDSNPAAALGGVRKGTNPLELAAAYGQFANDGMYVRPHAIVKVTDLLGNTVYTERRQRRRAIDTEYARQTVAAMRRVVTDGQAELKANLTVGRFRQLAGKTGTTEDNSDAWFAGTTPQMAMAVWTGYATSRQPLRNLPGATNGEVFGATVPAKTFNALAAEHLRGKPVLKFKAPRGVQRIPSVRGRTLDHAQRKLGQFRFTSVVYTARFDRNAKPFTVLSVTPRAGAFVARSSRIEVVYATNQRSMPDLTGRMFTDVERELGSFAGDIKLTTRVDETVAPGTVLEQQPYVGSQIYAGNDITLTVAAPPGPERIKKVPYVPEKSELAQLRRQVDAARAQVTVPDLIGADRAVARQALESLGLTVQISGTGTDVIDQSVAGGSAVQRASTVTLTVQPQQVGR